MCGISGVALPPGRRVDTAILAGMMRCLDHRGPDDHGWLSMNGADVRTGRDGDDAPPSETVLASQRLAIVDLTSDGWQPMSSADGRYHLVYNGEVYNYVELRAELHELGWKFHSQSDSEVVLAAFAARVAGVAPATITATLRWIKSATSVGSRSCSPCAQRYSIVTRFPST